MTDQPTTEQHTDDAATPTGTPHADTTTVDRAADHGATAPRDGSTDPGTTAATADAGPGSHQVAGAEHGLTDAMAAVDAPTVERPEPAAETPSHVAPADAAVTDGPSTDTAPGSTDAGSTDAGSTGEPALVSSTDVETATAADPTPVDAPVDAPVDGPDTATDTAGAEPALVSSTDVETATATDPTPVGAPADNAPADSAVTDTDGGDTPGSDTAGETDRPHGDPLSDAPAATRPDDADTSGARTDGAHGDPLVTETPAAVAAVASRPAETRAPVDPALADTPPPPVRRASSDPDRWGRVDADGTVHVRTEDGERAVGSWQAGEPQEGLAHFARRFDDVLTEVELIAARLASGHGDPKQLSTSLRQHRDALADAHVVGDLVGLQRMLDHLLAKADRAIGVARQARDAARQQSTARKQALVEEAEKIAEEATQWKVAGDRLREILDEWKTIRGVDRKTDDVLWKRFGKARDAFNRRRGSHFAEMDRQRAAAKTRKEEIVEEAERISTSGEWGPTAGRYKQLMTDWKAAGRAPKDADDVLWQRFRAAQDAFFSRRSSAFTERDSELTENATKKEALLVEAERIDPAKGGVDAARAALHRIQERWDAIGHVPRERMREFEQRLRQVEERVRGAADAQWRRSDPETEARVAQFRERVEQFETQAKKARAAGDERRAKQADAQAAQWREWLAAAEQAAADR